MREDKKYYLTAEGLAKTQEDYERLKNEALPKVIAKLQRAQEEESELFENVLYNEAMQEKGQIEDRIVELESVLKNYELIEGSSGGKVDLGSTIVVEIEGDVDTFVLVGSLEAAPEYGKISNESPVGKALLGHKTGDEVKVELPNQLTLIYKIKEVK